MIRMEPLNSSQQKQLLETARATGLREFALCSIALSHAIRCSELANLTPKDFNLRESTITIRRLKNSISTVEKMTPQEIEPLRELLARTPVNGRLFPYSRKTVYLLWRRCIEKAGLPDSSRGIHAAKHSVLQTLCDKGLTLPQLMRCGGHKHASSSLKYYEVKQITADDLRLRALGSVA